MRDFRDAKAMAQTLRQSLTQKSVSISHSESLELVSKMLGAADWNTLSALIQAGRREGVAAAAAAPAVPGRYPAIPLRDLVPFPTAIYPLFAGRQKTVRALDHAFERQREIVIAVQKDAALDEPTTDDCHDIGVLARLAPTGAAARRHAEGADRDATGGSRSAASSARATAIGPISTTSARHRLRMRRS